jgi:hypothetical protein
MDIPAIVEQFFRDCETDSCDKTDENLTAWLWFTCPASVRTQVYAAITGDARWRKESES